MSEALTRDRILDAAERVLRRFGPRKATVTDVARELGVSHAAVYRHVESKAALTEAVTDRWLKTVSAPLAAVATSDEAPPTRLRRWLDTLRRLKRAKIGDDPEMFATYHALAEDARDIVGQHVRELIAQLERIVRDGMATGDFAPGDSREVAAAILDATFRFHHPAHAASWSDPGQDAAFEAVWRLVLRAVTAR